jgi:hypothetical protein
MIIATLAYYQRSSDISYLTQHYNILKQWTGYLVNEALIPANQLSTDDFQGTLANQTNLALKGIIGIEAMSVIAQKTGNTADSTNFHNIATDYISKWQGYAVVTSANPPHTNLAYQDDSSHGMNNSIIRSCEWFANKWQGSYTIYMRIVCWALTSSLNPSTTCKVPSIPRLLKPMVSLLILGMYSLSV